VSKETQRTGIKQSQKNLVDLFSEGSFFLKVSKYKSDKKPASVDLPNVINSAESWLLFGPSAILVATGVIENINIPTSP